MKNIKTLILLFSIVGLFCSFSLAGAFSYEIKEGDTLTKISEKTNIGIDNILKNNPQIINPNIINKGDYLELSSNEEMLGERTSNDWMRTSGRLTPIVNSLDFVISSSSATKTTSTAPFYVDVSKDLVYMNSSPIIGGSALSANWKDSGTISYQNTGNVGIGTTTPLAKLEINTNSVGSGDLFAISSSSYGSVMAITKNGNVGIGIVPSYKFHISNSSDVAEYILNSGTVEGFYLNNSGIIDSNRYGLFVYSGTSQSTGAGLVGINGAGGGTMPLLTISNSGTGNAIQVDTSEFVIKNDGKIGIGTTTPSSQFHLVTTAETNPFNIASSTKTSLFYINKSGNVGIGTTTPLAKLEINTDGSGSSDLFAISSSSYASVMAVSKSGNIGLANTSPNAKLEIASAGSITLASRNSLIFSGANGTNNYFQIGLDNVGSLMIDNLYSAPINTMTFTTGGNIGIGTTTPRTTLDVRGKIAINPTLSVSSALHVQPSTASTDLVRFFNSDYTTGVGSGLLISTGATSGDTYTRLQAYDAGATSDNSLILNPVGGNIGIGETAPNYKLEVNGTIHASGTSANLIVDNKIGIASTSPNAPLAIDGTADATRLDAGGGRLVGLSTVPINPNEATSKYYVDDLVAKATSTHWKANGANIYNVNSGNVGIGTTTPDTKLVISGADSTNIIKIYDSTAKQYVVSTGVSNGLGGFLQLNNATGDTKALIRSYASGLVQGYFTAGYMGFGTSTPAGVIHAVTADLSATALFERDGASDLGYTAARILARKTTNMGDGFGGRLAFAIKDDANVNNYIGAIGAVRSGRDDSGSLFFNTFNAGSDTEKMRITNVGNVGIGTTSPSSMLHLVATAGTNPLNIASSTKASLFYVNKSGNVGIGTLNAKGLFNVDNEVSTILKARLHTESGSTDATVGLGFGVDTTNKFMKSSIFHERKGSNGLGDLVFAVDSNNDTSDVITTDEKMRITSAGNIGIGTTSPSSMLHLVATAGTNPFNIASSTKTSLFYINKSGNVGIGTTTPVSLLHVASQTATSTATFGDPSTSVGCLRFIDTDLGGYTYCTFLDGTMTCNNTNDCAN